MAGLYYHLRVRGQEGREGSKMSKTSEWHDSGPCVRPYGNKPSCRPIAEIVFPNLRICCHNGAASLDKEGAAEWVGTSGMPVEIIEVWTHTSICFWGKPLGIRMYETHKMKNFPVA